MSGRLVYVMGPSGAGKDSLLSFARSALADEPVVFAHRYITRPAGQGENFSGMRILDNHRAGFSVRGFHGRIELVLGDVLNVLVDGEHEIRAWQRLALGTGKGTLPRELSSDADVKKAIAADVNGIGYIDKSAVDSSVKVVAELQ